MEQVKIVKNFKTSGGKHCITNALKQVFDYLSYPLSEEMIFGIGSGLSFCYVNLASSPFLSGRVKPFEFEQRLADNLNFEIKCISNKDTDLVHKKTLQLLDEDNPVLVYADMAYLPYLNLNKESHFGGHAIVIFGYDINKKKFYVSDRDNDDYAIRTPKGNISKNYHLVDFEDMKAARGSSYRPFPANNKYLIINIKNAKPLCKDIIYNSIKFTCENMLHPPAKLLGINGILKFSKEILKWKSFDDEKLKLACVTNYFQINADGGTGGGAFRKMFGDFLIQASKMLDLKEFNLLGNEYLKIAEKWDEVAHTLWNLSENMDRRILEYCSQIIEQIYIYEKEVLQNLLKQI